MASVTSLGTGSGIDLGSILQQLVEAERAPATQRLDLKEAETQATISAFGSLKSSLAEFQAILKDLTSLTDFQGRTATSSDDTIFTATADSTASVGNTNINVLNLAAAQKLVTGDFAGPDTIIGTGTLSIETGGSNFSIDITTGSLTDIKDSINASPAGELITASILTVDDGLGGTVSKLVVSSKATGAVNGIEITVADDDLTNENNAGLSQLLFENGNINNQLIELTPATNARITVDGFTVSSATNEFTGAIQGITISALKASVDPVNDPPSVLAIDLNETSVKGKVASFVTVFNGLKTTLNQLSDYDPETSTAGLLNGDATVRAIETQVERILFSTVGDAEGIFQNLAQLGITTGEGGTLSLDQETLDAAIDNNFDDIGQLFASENGLARQLDDLMTGFLSATGAISVREEGLDGRLEEIADDRVDLARRLAVIEERTRQQFTALDSLISRLNSSGDFLLQQLQNTSAIITGINNNDN